MGRGFVLHSGDYLREGTTRIDGDVAVTATVEIVQDIADGKGPEKVVMALGYTGWSAGQLDEEIKHNGWLTAAPDEGILFDGDLELKWDRAMAKIGISPAMLSDAAGHVESKSILGKACLIQNENEAILGSSTGPRPAAPRGRGAAVRRCGPPAATT